MVSSLTRYLWIFLFFSFFSGRHGLVIRARGWFIKLFIPELETLRVIQEQIKAKNRDVIFFVLLENDIIYYLFNDVLKTII